MIASTTRAANSAISGERSNLGPWQQGFRACWSQRHSLRRVYVLPSHDTKDQLAQFKEFMQVLLPGLSIEPVPDKSGELYQHSVRPKDTPESRDYEDYDYVAGASSAQSRRLAPHSRRSSCAISGSMSPLDESRFLSPPRSRH
ncbi:MULTISPECIES: hypothetical protein [unclassified Bradyrhizobium]|uniref:hypothetical protein n=1 Tax=unclassified Bradyrhizobium TaxID=2631580 RepID=UPI0028E5C1E1|nr:MULTISPECIES: hypothetical protein [unclassified Bradyrhizobium]